MCGIVGLLIKNPARRGDLGRLMRPMFACMAERGPDSAGLAVFGQPTVGDSRRFSLFAPRPDFDWRALARETASLVGSEGNLVALGNHATLATALAPNRLRELLASRFPLVHLLSVGRSIEVFKDEGHPNEIADRYDFESLSGTHLVGHTRMATESAVSPAHAHPFTAGEDFCLVHNGSLSNPYMLRRELESYGLRFETDNDTEAACRFIEWRMSRGESLDEALRASLARLDGFYTLLIATDRQLTIVRDAFACKPAVVAETEDYVAIASEFRSLAHLPGVAAANVFEPLPEEVYSWRL